MTEHTGYKELKILIGKTVLDIKEFGQKTGFNSGFLVFFNDGIVLTAQDGEYGDNTLEILNTEEVGEKLKLVDESIV